MRFPECMHTLPPSPVYVRILHVVHVVYFKFLAQKNNRYEVYNYSINFQSLNFYLNSTVYLRCKWCHRYASWYPWQWNCPRSPAKKGLPLSSQETVSGTPSGSTERPTSHCVRRISFIYTQYFCLNLGYEEDKSLSAICDQAQPTHASC